MDGHANNRTMPIKPEEALETLGFDIAKFDDIDAFKEALETKFVARDQAVNDKDINSKVLGKFNSVLSRKVAKVAKELDIEVPEGTNPIDMIEALTPGITGLRTSVNEWKEKAEKGLGDDVVKEWEKKVKALEKERDIFKGQAVEVEGKYNALNEEIVTTKKRTVVDTAWDRALAGITFHAGVDELRREGFVSKAKSKYRIELDEELKPTLKDAKGDPIKHPKRVGELLTLDEALKLDAKEFKLTAENPHANKVVEPVNGRKPVTPPVATPVGGRRERTPAPRWGMGG